MATTETALSAVPSEAIVLKVDAIVDKTDACKRMCREFEVRLSNVAEQKEIASSFRKSRSDDRHRNPIVPQKERLSLFLFFSPCRIFTMHDVRMRKRK